MSLIQGLHEKFWHCPSHELQTMLHGLGVPVEIVKLASPVVSRCPSCQKYSLPKHKENVKTTVTIRFNERAGRTLFHLGQGVADLGG